MNVQTASSSRCGNQDRVINESKHQSIGTWVQIAATIGVLVGLALVIVELQQAKALTRAQLGSQHIAEITANQRLLVGENSASSMLRACLYPDQLTDEDRIVLINLYQAVASLAFRAMALEQIGEFGSDWEGGARFNYQIISRTEFGRNWLTNTQLATPRLGEIRDEVIASTDGQYCANELRPPKEFEESP